ncbi:MAG: dihydrolipoamide acetyltransferase family protein [Candidatus Dormibacteria bacterium]|jgi:2-oxoisovalerate dehydrogenase E2 component (dihydrolipoyl transacylase)
MALTVSMPQLGESVTEGTIARWLKQPGEPVARYESIAEVASDKVNAEIPAPADGTFGEIIAVEGSVVSVGQPICTIEQGAGAPVEAPLVAPAAPAAPQAAPAPASQTAPAAAPQAAPAAAPGATPVPIAAADVRRAAVTPAAAVAEAALSAAPQAAPAGPAPATAAPGTSPAATAAADANGAAQQHVTPAVRMLAREQGVDLSAIRGTGIGGRVTKKDVLDHVQSRNEASRAAGPAPAVGVPIAVSQGAPSAAGSAPAAPVSAGGSAPAAPAPSAATLTPSPTPAAALPSLSASAEEGDQLLPMTSVRRAIADHMVRSRQTSPHAWLAVEVDMSRVVRLRERTKAAFRERYGISLTYLPFVARAVVEALRRRPTLNAQWSEAGLVLKHDINLGIAVALEENLVVPVLRNADRLSIAGLAQAMSDLGNRARANRLKLDEIQGGTFTLNNTGALGAVLTQAIINQPQAAILTMDAVIKRAVVVDDMIAIRPIMNLGMSFDHRLNDGLQAARFLQDVRGQLEGLDEGATLL